MTDSLNYSRSYQQVQMMTCFIDYIEEEKLHLIHVSVLVAELHMCLYLPFTFLISVIYGENTKADGNFETETQVTH